MPIENFHCIRHSLVFVIGPTIVEPVEKNFKVKLLR